MQRWEYHTAGPVGGEPWRETLTLLGSAGWELVQMVSLPNLQPTWIFKRPVEG